MSEKECVITSMNLYRYSQKNNFEMGIYFDKKEKELFKDTRKEINKIIANSDYEKFSSLLTGYCIRTGKEIPFNPQKPLSYNAFQEWVKWENEFYPENYCHATGKKSNGKTNFANPIL